MSTATVLIVIALIIHVSKMYDRVMEAEGFIVFLKHMVLVAKHSKTSAEFVAEIEEKIQRYEERYK